MNKASDEKTDGAGPRDDGLEVRWKYVAAATITEGEEPKMSEQIPTIGREPV
jgi:hypothetical protein